MASLLKPISTETAGPRVNGRGQPETGHQFADYIIRLENVNLPIQGRVLLAKPFAQEELPEHVNAARDNNRRPARSWSQRRSSASRLDPLMGQRQDPRSNSVTSELRVLALLKNTIKFNDDRHLRWGHPDWRYGALERLALAHRIR